MFETWFQVESFVTSGRLNLEPIVTHQIAMTDFESAFKMMQSGEAIKVVLEIPQEGATKCQTQHTSAVVAS